MNVVSLWTNALVGVGPVFHVVFTAYLYAWAFALTRESFAVARMLAAHVGLWGIVGTYLSLIVSLQIDLADDGGLKTFQKLLSFGPESSLIGLTLFLAMNVLHHFVQESDT
ncbi:MAG: hypothetical protein HY657_09470 [Acidobacteria bacterium]|nr:hypothetical protein [Acidobacteriota bacterium]